MGGRARVGGIIKFTDIDFFSFFSFSSVSEEGVLVLIFDFFGFFELSQKVGNCACV